MNAVRLIPDVQVGDLFVEDYDLGIFKKLDGELIGDAYYLPGRFAPGIEPPLFTEFARNPDDVGKQMPGIPILFANSEDSVTRYAIPCIRVRREDPSPALERWASLHEKYRRPAPGAKEVTLTIGNRTFKGYDRYEMQPSSWPYDIPYTITFEANGKSARTHAQALIRHGLRRFPPYGALPVYDSIGTRRVMNTFTEGPSELTVASDIRDRTIIYGLSVRVKGFLDVAYPYETPAVTQQPVINFGKK